MRIPVRHAELVHQREHLLDADALAAVATEVAGDVGVLVLTEEVRPRSPAS